MMAEYLAALAAVLVAPFIGGVLMGIDRIVSARLQSRQGPPLFQPFYDILKLFAKRRMAANTFQMISVSVYLASMVLSLALLFMGQDLLVLLFILALGNIMLILGGISVKSPYSQLGSQREVIVLLAYEPLLVCMVVGTYIMTGSFSAASIFGLERPLALSMPAFVITQALVMAMKLHKSPFDVSASHHAHQELVRGIYTEFSGPQMAVIELAHLYELVLLLGFIALFWHTNLGIGIALALACYGAVIVLDNISARMTTRWMFGFTWSFGLALAAANLAALYATGPLPR